MLRVFNERNCGMKACSKCGLVKDESEFYKRSSKNDKLRAICRICVSKYQKTPEVLKRHRKASAKYERTEKGKRIVAEKRKRCRANNPEKIAARNAVNNAVRDGRLEKKPCYCGELKLEGHHEDYSKPLDVEWLCTKHHID